MSLRVEEPPELSAPSWYRTIEPAAPHDDLTFEALSREYSYDRISDRRRLFVRLLIKELQKRPRPAVALDIGCGSGISEEAGVNVEYLAAVRAHAEEHWGIEPDQGMTPPQLFDVFQYATMEKADLPTDQVDVAYSYFVMEHVPDPERFLRAVYRVLKPGGTYLFITPNGRHFFTILAKSLKHLKLDELALRVVRAKSVEEYHYPVQYRVNLPSVIDAYAKQVGFLPPEYAFVEQFGMTSYFRGPLRPLLHMLVWKRKLLHNPRCLLNLICRLTKPATGAALA